MQRNRLHFKIKIVQVSFPYLFLRPGEGSEVFTQGSSFSPAVLMSTCPGTHTLTACTPIPVLARSHSP